MTTFITRILTKLALRADELDGTLYIRSTFWYKVQQRWLDYFLYRFFKRSKYEPPKDIVLRKF